MTGTVEHMSLAEARKNNSSSQTRLSSFGSNGDRDTTYIGIVNSDDGDVAQTVDEMKPALAPPDDLFYQWLETKKKLENDRAVTNTMAHNQALDRVDYRERFGKYLDSNGEALAALEELTERVLNGEHIVLVCYCGEGKWCHRESVTETLNSMVEQRINDG